MVATIDHQFRDDLTTEGANVRPRTKPERGRILAGSNLITLGAPPTIPTQTVQFSANQIPYQPGASLALPALFHQHSGAKPPGLTLNVHFDAGRLSSNTNESGNWRHHPNRIAAKIKTISTMTPHSHFIELIWADFNGTPGQPLPTVIATSASTHPPPQIQSPARTPAQSFAPLPTQPPTSFLNSSTELRPTLPSRC